MGGKASILGLVPGRPLFVELGKAMPAARDYLRVKEEMDAFRSGTRRPTRWRAPGAGSGCAATPTPSL